MEHPVCKSSIMMVPFISIRMKYFTKIRCGKISNRKATIHHIPLVRCELRTLFPCGTSRRKGENAPAHPSQIPRNKTKNGQRMTRGTGVWRTCALTGRFVTVWTNMHIEKHSRIKSGIHEFPREKSECDWIAISLGNRRTILVLNFLV